MGALGVTPQGVTETDTAVVRAERQLIACADRVVLLVDSRKFQPRGNLVICPLAGIATVVTDAGVAPAAMAMLQSAGCEVIVAPIEPAGASAGSA
jgi:DeoR family ulaG and ulaABCDEF operon transcriptional repressor